MFPSWQSSLPFLPWLIALALPLLLVALYFLKLRRTPVEVPSTFLWKKTVEDLHVNSLFQRLRQNLLLLLQLLFLLLLLFALAGPQWRGTQLIGERFIFLIDRSASMSTEEEEGERLALAKEAALRYVDNMPTDAAAMVVSFSDRAQVEQTFTKNRSELKRKIREIEGSPRPTDLEDALKVSAGLANPGRSAFDLSDAQIAQPMPATVYLFSDGNFEPPNFSLEHLEPRYIPIGSDRAKNVGIIAFRVERNSERPDEMQAFVRLHNYHAEAKTVEVELYHQGELIGVQSVNVPGKPDRKPNPQETDPEADASLPSAESQLVTYYAGLVFQLRNFEEGVIEARIVQDDPFLADNRAWAVINPPRAGRVLVVTSGNSPLLYCLRTELSKKISEVEVLSPEVLKAEDYRELASSGRYDLVIFDRCRPEELPPANTFFINEIPSDAWSHGEPAGGPGIIDLDRSHPLLRFVQLDDVVILEAMTNLEGPAGTRTLIEANLGSLLSIAPRGGFQDAVLAFPIVTENDGWGTNWPLRPSFPVFVYQLLRYFGGGEESLNSNSVPPGAPISLRGPAVVDTIEVHLPNGQTVEVERNRRNTFDFVETEQLGAYQVNWGENRQTHFAVNLFNDQESDLKPEQEVQIGYVEVASQEFRQSHRIEGYRYLLVPLALILLAEWFFYNKRVRV
ncbi:von Willebrand factor type A [Planctomycetales bacterium 10988]|nr:von Willebrand factor type A [Planctomycetales bacterium 10988]